MKSVPKSIKTVSEVIEVFEYEPFTLKHLNETIEFLGHLVGRGTVSNYVVPFLISAKIIKRVPNTYEFKEIRYHPQTKIALIESQHQKRKIEINKAPIKGDRSWKSADPMKIVMVTIDDFMYIHEIIQLLQNYVKEQRFSRHRVESALTRWCRRNWAIRRQCPYDGRFRQYKLKDKFYEDHQNRINELVNTIPKLRPNAVRTFRKKVQ